MIYTLDIGGSTVDLVIFDRNNNTVISCMHKESQKFKNKNIEEICQDFGIADAIKENEKIYITGGKTQYLPKYFFFDTVKVELIKVQEFEALARGASFLSKKKSGLAVSLGTGTAMVSFVQDEWAHVKGTGVGGGSFIGLGKALLGVSSFYEIANLAKQGSSENINLSVGEIVGGGIGELSADMTASHFAKYTENTSKVDIAFGIASLVAESITALAIEKALRYKHEYIIVGGKFSQLSILQKQMKQTGEKFGLQVIFPPFSHAMTAVGASIV